MWYLIFLKILCPFLGSEHPQFCEYKEVILLINAGLMIKQYLKEKIFSSKRLNKLRNLKDKVTISIIISTEFRSVIAVCDIQPFITFRVKT